MHPQANILVHHHKHLQHSHTPSLKGFLFVLKPLDLSPLHGCPISRDSSFLRNCCTVSSAFRAFNSNFKMLLTFFAFLKVLEEVKFSNDYVNWSLNQNITLFSSASSVWSVNVTHSFCLFGCWWMQQAQKSWAGIHSQKKEVQVWGD